MHVLQDKDTIIFNREMCRKYSEISLCDEKAISDWMHSMFDLAPDQNVVIRPPFVCNDGKLIHFRGTAYLNACVIIEHRTDVWIGDNVRIGPNVTLAATNHSLDPQERKDGISDCQPIAIGDNVWIGANSVILPGVTIGDNSVIGAGSVVTRSIPEGVVAFGNPCRVQKSI